MVRIIFMAKETPSSMQAIKYLLSQSNCFKVVRAVLREQDKALYSLCIENYIDVSTEEVMIRDFENGELEVDYIFSFYWKKASKEAIRIPDIAAINFHPGPLPEARGSAYHVAILEDWGYWGVTAHYMDENLDTGEIIKCRHFDLEKGIVNADLVELTHQYLSELFMDIMGRIIDGEDLNGVKQKEGHFYSISKLESMKRISNCKNSADIDRKIRAFWNPPYSGAQIELYGKTYTLINDQILEWIHSKLGGVERKNRVMPTDRCRLSERVA